MNILVVSMMYAPDNFRINEITARLAKQGHTVTVVTGLPDYATSRIPKEYRFWRRRRERINGCTVVRMPTTARRKGVLFRALNYASFAVCGAVYARFCKKPQADVVFSFDTSPVFQVWPAAVFAKRLGVPLVVYCLDIWPEALKAWGVREGNPLFKWVRRISRKLMRRADALPVTSAPFIPYLTELGVNPDRLSYLPQDCDDAFGGEPPAPPAGKDTYDIYFCGNVGSVQQAHLLLQALALVPQSSPVRVHIVGDGSELPHCRQLAEQLQLRERAVFHGRLPQSEMPAVYAGADALAVTLRGGDFIGQTLPGKLQTYMCAGRPILACADGATAETVAAADCGICVPSGQVDALAEAMQRMAEQRDTFIQKGRNGRAYYEQHFTPDRFDAALLALLEQTEVH